jgi:hypothetical protein
MKKISIVLFGVFLATNTPVFSQGFLKTENKNIVDGSGEVAILRGMGLGGWMLMEGYMMQTASFASPQHKIRKKIVDLIGKTDTDAFFDAWLANHCRKIDIDSLAAWGFNSVRLPLHYNLFTLPIEEEPVAGSQTWLDKGFDMVDSLLSWCAANEMYLILDLHAAPGGQGYDAAISDYDDSKPSLWESRDNQDKTVALWRELAERYADEPWIGGYDLINETNWNLPGNSLLKLLYERCILTIRAVDNNHIIFIEGNWFANDFTGLTPPFDNNMAYSFHKYWSYNDQGSIGWMINLRNQFNIPIWCGESGENSNVWFTDAIKLFERNNIGWAWWPMKKIESISGPLSIKKSPGYQTLLDYWEGRSGKPSAEYAKNALMELAENAKLENCEFHPDVIDAMMRQTGTDLTKKFATNRVPGKIPAVHYDMGTNEEAYYDTQIANYQVSTGEWTAWNNGFAYRNDGVDIEPSSDSEGYPFNVGWIETDEWLKYTLTAVKTDSYNVKLRISSPSDAGIIHLVINNKVSNQNFSIPNTGGWQNWETLDIGNIYIPQGNNSFTVQFVNGGFNLNQIEFIATQSIIDPETISVTFRLEQNYPNPFNEETKIPFYLSAPTFIKITIYDTRGNQITDLGNTTFEAGERFVTWDGTTADGNSVSSGMYYYHLKVGDNSSVKSMLYLR